MDKCSHPDCSVELGLISTDLGLLCGLHIGAAVDVVRGEQRLIEAEQRIAELETQLAALTWTPISESNLPKGPRADYAGDELLDAKHNRVYQMPEGYAPMIPMAEDFTMAGWTHFRSINPPAPERGVK